MSSKQSFETLCYEIENDSTSKGVTYNAYIKIPYFTENFYTPIFFKKILLSVTLTHSLEAYESNIHTSLIYGVFIEEKIQYAINVSHNFSRVLEAKAKYNKVISTQHLKLIDEWLKIQQQNFNVF
jgi:hypothetical protein